MALNSYVTLGRSGLRVSPLCLGTMTFGEEWGWGASVEDSEGILSAYLGHGGNFIDTANIYTNGHSEAIIGNYFAARKGARDRVVISTKFFGSLFEGDPNAGGAGRKALVQQCEESLRRLRTDYIDIYWLHNWDRRTPIEETMRGLDDLVASGKIRYIGISDLPAWSIAEAQTIARFRGWAPIIGVQLEYSLLERTSEGELLPMAEAMGIGVVPWSPLKGGLLSGKYRRENADDLALGRAAAMGAPSAKSFEIIEELVAVAEELGTSPAAAALAWVMRRPGVFSTLIGARTLAQLEANLVAFDVKLTDEHHARLDAVSVPIQFFPHTLHSTLGPQLAFPGTTVDGECFGPSPVLGTCSNRY
jgi:aryl-alcohol dehydrogenase-like predicted oxidoreductase